MTMQKRSLIPSWLPNAISVFRIVLVPVWALCAEWCRSAVVTGDFDTAATMRTLSVVVLLTIGVSDVLDGFLARHFGLTSRMGATLDAFADKLVQVGLLLFFAVRGAPAFPSIPVWFFTLVFGRDVLLAIGYLILHKCAGRVRVVHRPHGKISSVLLFVLLVLLTANFEDTWTAPLVGTITAVVVLSTALYTRDGFTQLRESRSQT